MKSRYKWIALVLLLSINFVLYAKGKKEDDLSKEKPENRTPVSTLKQLASVHNIAIGTALSKSGLRNQKLVDTLLREFNSLTAENEMKFYAIRKNQYVYNFGPADEIVQFALDNNMAIRGHTLVWHNAMPSWVENGKWTKDELLQMLKEYITEVVTRYKGKVSCWDVVNEVFEEDGELRNEISSVWNRICGEEYIEKAFIWAHEADPDALLFINDYNIETVNPKSNAVYNLVEKLLAQGVPVHGLGIQAHLVEEVPLNYRSFYNNIKRFAELGLYIHITELDVRIKSPVTEKKLKNQAEIYAQLIKIALSFDKVNNITMWGISDAYSWVPGVFTGYGSALLFDDNFNPKPAFYGVEDALVKGPEKLNY
jgi:endo-1,4-beta-xylanase